MKTIYSVLRLWIVTAGLVPVIIPVYGQIATDGTVGSAQSLTGPNYAIGAGLGTQRGANLFHSFSTFNIHTGESATFSGPNGLQNVISRVTGGSLSSIDGTLRSEVTGANVWFINPAGVVFGANAKLDVPAAFHVSTADELRFADGGVFSAANPAGSTLSSEPVAAFGFTSAAPKRIEVNGGYLNVKEGQTLSLIGGDISLSNATIYAPAGRLNIASVGSAGEVVPTATDLELRGFGALGTLTMVRDSQANRVKVDRGQPFGSESLGDFDTSGAGGGAMFIRGGNWLNQGGWIYANTYGSRAGKGIDVAFNDTFTLRGIGKIATKTFGAGDAVPITISARNLFIDGENADIRSDADDGSTGAGGNIKLTATDTLSLNDGQISNITWSTGDAGSITINAGNLLMDGYSAEISSYSGSGSTGAGGNINLMVADTFSILNNAQIIGGLLFGSGSKSSITINALNLHMDNEASIRTRVFFGAAADINLNIANTLSIRNDSVITASSFEQGDAGSINIAAGNLLVEGHVSSIESQTDGDGRGGNINLTIADTLSLRNGGDIKTSSGFDKGDAGSISISARNLIIDGQGRLSSIASGTDGDGDGGDINLAVTETLSLRNGGRISAGAGGGIGGMKTGDAGAITITADNLLVDAQGNINSTSLIESTTSGAGLGGDINITVGDTLSLLNGGQIIASGAGMGDAGSVIVKAGQAVQITGGAYPIPINDTWVFPSGVFAQSLGMFFIDPGNAGDITVTTPALTISDGGIIQAQSSFTSGGSLLINAADLRLLNGGQISTSVFGDATTTGGNVEINSRTVVALDGSTVTAKATQGKGGNILVNTEAFFYDAASIDDVLNASSESTVAGNQGTVEVNAATDPARSVIGVSRRTGDLRDANPDPCARRKGQKKSTLTQVGRGGLPADNRPEGMTVSLGGGDWTPPAEPAEPTLPVQEPLTLNADPDDCRL